MMSLLRLGLTALGGAGLLTKVIVVFGLLTAVGTAYGVWHYKVYTRGYKAAISDIGRGDKRAIGQASKERDELRNCAAQNLEYDQTTGKCVK